MGTSENQMGFRYTHSRNQILEVISRAPIVIPPEILPGSEVDEDILINCLTVFGCGYILRDYDFSEVMSSQKQPIRSDIPRERVWIQMFESCPIAAEMAVYCHTLWRQANQSLFSNYRVLKVPPDLNRTPFILQRNG